MSSDIVVKNKMKKIFVTGGAGYIGTHTILVLLEAGYSVRVYDNLTNSYIEAIKRVEKLTDKSVEFINGDIRDKDTLTNALIGSDAIIHFAGLKAVGESTQKPLEYYDNNVIGTIRLIEAMRECNIKNMIFSSSASVYGNPKYLPMNEVHPKNPTNPYSKTKSMIEEILKDTYHSDNSFNFGILRYFNPIGAHPSSEIGEDPQGVPNNLMPYITQVASGRLDKLRVFGDDYDTPDGTGVRDYIHVMDLANGHLKMLEHLKDSGLTIYNLGTGRGYSVLEIIKTFERVNNIKIPYEIVGRRAGDVDIYYADPTKAQNELNWRATRDLEQMCIDAWRWQLKNPNGYRSSD